MRISLEEHIRLSREAVKVNKAKGNLHVELLNNLYTDPFRFIDEILQNTEDAYARGAENRGKCVIRFCLHDDRLDIFHDGKDFDEDDIKAITTLAGSTKKGNKKINQIGKFGIGFRSVYSVTQTPEIHCSPWHFTIKDFEIPEMIEAARTDNRFKTLIRLPFGDKNIFSNLLYGIQKLDEYSLLFLNHLTTIEIFYKTECISIIERTSENISARLRRVTITESKKNSATSFLLIQTDNVKEKYAIGFRLACDESGKEKIIRDDFGKIFVYFPTMQETHLYFLLHANFTTNPTREQIPFDNYKAPENLKLLKKICTLFSSSLIELRDKGYITSSFLNVLPLSPIGNGIIYNSFKGEILNAFKNKPLLPTIDNKFINSEQAAYSENVSLINLLKKEGLQLLYSRKNFINPDFCNIQGNKEVLINMMSVRSVDPESFGFRLSVNQQFIKSKKISWFIDFYSFLSVNYKLWDEANSNEYYSLREKPFILLDNGHLSPAYDKKGIASIRFPRQKQTERQLINKKLLKNENCRIFFQKLGIGTDDNHKLETEYETCIPINISKAFSGAKIIYDNVTENNIISTDNDKIQVKITDTPILSSFDFPDANAGIMSWSTELAYHILKKEFPSAEIRKQSNSEFSADIYLYENGNETTVYIGARQLPSPYFIMPQKHFLSIVSQTKAVTSTKIMLILVKGVGLENPEIQIIHINSEKFNFSRFFFEPVQFRIL